MLLISKPDFIASQDKPGENGTESRRFNNTVAQFPAQAGATTAAARHSI